MLSFWTQCDDGLGEVLCRTDFCGCWDRRVGREATESLTALQALGVWDLSLPHKISIAEALI